MADRPARRQLEATAATKRQWRTQDSVLLTSGICFAGVVAVEVISFKGLVLPVVLLVEAILMVGGLFAYVSYFKNPAHLPAGDLWVGNAGLRLSQLKRAELTKDLCIRSERRLNFWFNGLLSARLEVRNDGLHWILRFLARLGGVSGSVNIPWDQVSRIEIGGSAGIAGSSRGGHYVIHLATGDKLDGRFLGWREGLEVQLPSRLR